MNRINISVCAWQVIASISKPATSERFEYLQYMITKKARDLYDYKQKQVMEPKKVSDIDR